MSITNGYNLSIQKPERTFFAIIFCFSLLFYLTIAASGRAQNPPADPASQSDVNKLVRDVIHHEIQTELSDQSLWRYREVYVEGGKKKLMDVCQTKDGEIQRLLAINGQELSPKQRQAEDQRIQRLVAHPDQLQQMKKKQREDADQMRNLLKMFPEAFQFQFGGRQGDLVRVNFAPNPKFHPATRPAQVFHHMTGNLLIDEKSKHIVEINGQLTSEVKFGGGFLGHLDKGGTFTVKQQDVGSGHWELTFMDIRMNGKALFFKTLSVRETEINTDFHRVPDNIVPRQAAELFIKDVNGIRDTKTEKASSN